MVVIMMIMNGWVCFHDFLHDNHILWIIPTPPLPPFPSSSMFHPPSHHTTSPYSTSSPRRATYPNKPTTSPQQQQRRHLQRLSPVNNSVLSGGLRWSSGFCTKLGPR